MQQINGYTTKWWKEAVVYQVYPRSFKDTNGDGIGDLKGVTSKLDYLATLHVNVIWLSPHFDSPNADNGYDIRDYRQIMREFGTMADFDELLAGIKRRNMRLIIDLVVNHTSDEHAWFVQSQASRNNFYRDFYIWRSDPDGKEPNDWLSFFGGSAWKKDAATDEHYLHLFGEKQPDLNWDNPHVRQEVYDLMRFWLDKGVDGFRMDVIPFISKDQAFRNYPTDFDGHPEFIYSAGPKIHEYLQEMNREVLSKYDVMTVGEAFGVPLNDIALFVADHRRELNMMFHFDVVRLDRDGWRVTSWTLPQLKAVYGKLDSEAGKDSWSTVFLGNHDTARCVSHFGDDSTQYRRASAKALAMMMFTQRGTPFIYQGEELGMTNYPFESIDDYQDVEAKAGWTERVLSKQVAAEDYLSNLRQMSRDNARTPMQWDGSANGGFTTAAKAWLAVNPNYREINAEQQSADPESVYQFYCKLLDIRNQNPAFVYGDYHDIDPLHPYVFAYTRTLDSDRYLVVLNLSQRELSYKLAQNLEAKKQLLSNLGRAEENVDCLHLERWEARLYTL